MAHARILLADDDHELGELLARFLVREGFSVEQVHDGDAVLRRPDGAAARIEPACTAATVRRYRPRHGAPRYPTGRRHAKRACARGGDDGDRACAGAAAARAAP